MDTPPTNRLEEIFAHAVALPDGERAAWLDVACAGNAGLRAEVEALLRSHKAASFMKGLPAGPEIEAELARLKPEEVGDRIGNYKLLEQIGEGGFGTVWVAEQEAPMRRRVALKIIKLGMDTKEVVARFEQERQALAMMDHSNIAKVFDAGATQYGRPYFVMELVRGIRITEYCDQANLSTVDRLKLFIAVCNAVQHAHQKGIIHRDLKPSNILVTLHDGVPVPKVIDFGVAKATQSQRLTDLTVYTQFEQMIGTPLYMSPEQAGMSGLDIDTRSDIYSLGVLLYELLTGLTPFDPEKLMQRGIDEMRRVIREQEPQKPSTALHTMALQLRSIVAVHRQVEPAKLINLIRGDLDWIVMKALEKDRSRRYETANSLADDLERHLAQEPVLAAAPSATYRFGKLIRRHKRAFATAAFISVALTAAAGLIIREAIRAKNAESVANQDRLKEHAAREEAEAVSGFLVEVFQNARPEFNSRSITVADALKGAVEKLGVALKDYPERQVKLEETIARTYSNLGLRREAILLFEKALNYRRATLGPEHEMTLRVTYELAQCYSRHGRTHEATELQEKIFALRQKINGLEHPDTISVALQLSNSYYGAGRRAEALKMREKLLPMSQMVNGADHLDTIRAMTALADSLHGVGRLGEALKLREHALVENRRLRGPEGIETIAAMDRLAATYQVTDRLKDAIKLGEEAVALSINVNGPRHPSTLGIKATLAYSYILGGRLDKAIPLQEEILALRREVLGPDHDDTFKMMSLLAYSYGLAGRHAEALKLYEEGSSGLRRVRGTEHDMTIGAMSLLAIAYDTAGRGTEAIKLREEALGARRKLNERNSPVAPPAKESLARCLDALAQSYLRAERGDDALKLWEEALPIIAEVCGEVNPFTIETMENLANAYARASRTAEALAIRKKLQSLRQQVLSPEHTPTRSDAR